MTAGWWKPVPGSAKLWVLVQPRASRTKVLGEHEGRLSARDVKKAQVILLDGQTGRRKRLKVTGVDAAAAALVIC